MNNKHYIYFENIKTFGICKYMIVKLKQDEYNYKTIFRKLLLKYLKNKSLREKLLQTKNKIIFFCDKDLSVGVGFDTLECKKKYLDELLGQNLIGQILMEIRSRIQK